MAGRRRVGVVESRAVVFDRQLKVVLGAVERDPQRACARMLDGVQYRLLRDPQQVVLDIRRQIAGAVGEIELQPDVVGFGELARGLRDGRRQSL